jgi:uncharacterized delta-60 repeat protein
LVGGTATNSLGQYELALARYDSAGNLDGSFSTGGRAVNGVWGQANSIALLNDGKILQLGYGVLVRYNRDGSLDTDFGTNGEVSTPANGAGTDLAIASNGKIVVSGYVIQGYSPDGPPYDFLLVRYNSNGSLDPTFGTGGFVTTDFGALSDLGLAIAIQNDNKIIAAGYSQNSTDTRFALARYKSISIVPRSLLATTVGAAYNQTLEASDGSAPYSWSIKNGALASGLSLNSLTGEISGTPITAEATTFTVQVNDACGQTATQEFVLTVNPAPTITSTVIAPATIGQPYSQMVLASGGTTPFTWSVATGALPSGLSLDSAGGLIFGTSSATGSFAFTIQMQDANLVTASQGFTLRVNALPVITTLSSLPNGSVGSNYSTKLKTSGGTTPLSWSVTGGSLPQGLSLNGSSGNISGKPTMAGNYSFTVQVQDTNGAIDSKVFYLTMN